MPLVEFAHSTRQTIAEAQALLEGRRPITVALARQLERVIGGSVEFWLARDFQFHNDNAHLDDERSRWLGGLPVTELFRFGWVEPQADEPDALAAVLRFFGVGSIHEWRRRYSAIIGRYALRTSMKF